MWLAIVPGHVDAFTEVSKVIEVEREGRIVTIRLKTVHKGRLGPVIEVEGGTSITVRNAP